MLFFSLLGFAYGMESYFQIGEFKFRIDEANLSAYADTTPWDYEKNTALYGENITLGWRIAFKLAPTDKILAQVKELEISKHFSAEELELAPEINNLPICLVFDMQNNPPWTALEDITLPKESDEYWDCYLAAADEIAGDCYELSFKTGRREGTHFSVKWEGKTSYSWD